MANVKKVVSSSVTRPGTFIPDIPDTPTIGTATVSGTIATISFTPALTGGTPSSYTVTSNPGNIVNSGASSPILVSGLSVGTSYTFTVKAINSTGSSPTSAASNSVTPVAYATGGTIVTDATHYYHIFTSTGTFALTPNRNLTCDILVVAGGGGGGGGIFDNANGGGGGGAGGLRTFSSQSLVATPYNVTIGAGGAAGNNSTGVGGKGSNSQFNIFSSTGGGGGGSEAVTNNGGAGRGSRGGSAGGNCGSSITASLGNEGSYSPSEGNNGGIGPSGVNGGGGGGGAGAVGGNGVSISVAGGGGIGGTSALINAMAIATNTGELFSGNYYYAGGGGGGTYEPVSNQTSNLGGKGGGGKGNSLRSFPGDGTAGSANTGGGGGGSNSGSGGGRSGYAGGSGIVIIRYAI